MEEINVGKGEVKEMCFGQNPAKVWLVEQHLSLNRDWKLKTEPVC